MERKTIFAVSDIHGHCTLLKEALAQAGYCPHNPAHLLVCCGDYFDRGSENMAVLKYLEGLERKVLLRGNHEDMLLDIFRTGRLVPHHYANGTVATITEWFGARALASDGTLDFSGRSRVLDRVTEFIEDTVDYWETAHYVFAHGWLPGGEYWRQALPREWIPARRAKWTSQYRGTPPVPGKTLVCGHVPTFYAADIDPTRSPDDAGIYLREGLIVLDGGTFSSGQVNVLVLPDEPLLP